MLEVRDVSVRYGSKTIVDRVSFTVEKGQWLMILGPNGAGKSTLVNAIVQGAPYTGDTLYAGASLRRCKPADMAKKIGVLAQQHHVSYGFSVEEVVRLGRYAWSSGLFATAGSSEDDRMVEQALSQTGMAPLRGQSVLTLSGGELQRTFLAQLLAQNPEMLILDEPANYLDLVYQQQVFDLIRQWVQNTGRTVISVVHDLSLARAYGTHALLMKEGRKIAHGPIDTVLTPAHLEDVYAMDVYGWMQSMLGQWTQDAAR